MKRRTWIIILGISTILSGLGNAIKIYETIGGINMNIDMAWLILAVIFLCSITVLVYFNYKARKEDYKNFKQSTTENIRKLILKTESLEKEPIILLMGSRLETIKIYLRDYMRRFLVSQNIPEAMIEDLVKKFGEEFK